MRSPLEAIRAAKEIDTLPNGQPMTMPLSHALVVLASYWPNIWPSQERLAREMHCSRRHVNRLLGELEESGMIVRLPASGRTTRYRICFGAAAGE